MRPFTGAERVYLVTNNSVHVRLKVADSGGTLQDLSTSFRSATITADIENMAVLANVSLRRDGLALFIVNSIDVDRKITIETAVMPPGVGPGAGDWKNVFYGYIDSADWAQEPLTLACRDLSKKLLDTFIEVIRPYGSATPPGVPLENVIQAIIDDNAPPAPSPTWNPYPSITMPGGSPSAFVASVMYVPNQSVGEAIQARALQIGWDIRYRYGTGALPSLQFYGVNRTTPPVLDVYSPTEYQDVPELAIDDQSIRNFGRLTFVDASGTQQQVTSFDNTSIAKFGLRYFELGGDATAGLTTTTEAQTMIDAAVADLAYPRAAQTVRLRYDWRIELQDFLGWAANGVHYTSQQNFAVVSYTHTIGEGDCWTDIRCSGEPAGAYDAWLRLGTQDLTGAIAGFPEILFVAAPTEILGTDGSITGYKLAGRVDLDTNALIVTLSTGLTFKASSPTATRVTTPVVEDWLPMPPAGFFTIEVSMGSGKTGTVTLVPATVFNPAAAPPRGGTLGNSFIQRLDRAPVTSIYIREPTLTTRLVTLTVRPTTATIKYRFAPRPPGPAATDPWVIVPASAGGSITFSVDVSQSDIQLEFFAISVDQVAEDTQIIVLDKDNLPTVSATLAENAPNLVTVSLVLDDDVVAWDMWSRRGGLGPYLPNGSGRPDPTRLMANGTRQDSEITVFAEGNGTAAPSTVDVTAFLVIGYDKNGLESAPFLVSILVRGNSAPTTVGALSSVSAFGTGSGVSVTWSVNTIVEAAANTRFLVRIDENGVPMVTATDARAAKVDASGTDTIPNAGGWARALTPSNASTPGAQYLELVYDVRLYDTGVLVGSYQATHSGWFLGASGGTPPTGTPTASSLLLLGAGGVEASWTGLGLDPIPDIEIEWHESTDNFVANDIIHEIALLAPNTQNYKSWGYSPYQWVRERRRYSNAYGVGAWTGYSTSVQISGGLLP